MGDNLKLSFKINYLSGKYLVEPGEIFSKEIYLNNGIGRMPDFLPSRQVIANAGDNNTLAKRQSGSNNNSRLIMQ